ncbi:TetR/AcrR family transcriptional regulator [Rhabdothermincola salaria]|uniref:TetR/AcrR family transcriptional regulator n=1 Tax=Rhabdothermincola salaria TaxID=2903142 RepID=UPI001E544F7E|nr:TetR/AcrR family transcriptional regulator [Rhabdothermincola salaria]MCD9624902.1 TetR/AcrR family transcriptional regulator [Rhabdothermincola salaria]
MAPTTPADGSGRDRPDERRIRFYRAAVDCVDVAGLDATSVEDVARAAGSSRATLYRVFPGGRQQLITETVTWEVARFFARIESAVADEPDLASKLSTGLVVGHRALDQHALLQRLLRTEPEAVLSELSVATSLVLGAIVDYLGALLDRARRDGVVRADCDVPEAAEHLARLYLSYLGSPGRWDLDDPAAVGRLVESQFLAGVRAVPA